MRAASPIKRLASASAFLERLLVTIFHEQSRAYVEQKNNLVKEEQRWLAVDVNKTPLPVNRNTDQSSEELLNEREVAERLRVSVASVRRWRSKLFITYGESVTIFFTSEVRNVKDTPISVTVWPLSEKGHVSHRDRPEKVR